MGGNIMKHQIFWLIFSYLTAIPFLSYSMEDTNFKEIDSMKIEDQATNQVINSVKNTLGVLQEAVKNFMHYKLRFINEKQFKKFLIKKLLEATMKYALKNFERHSFFINTLDEFYQTAIDKDKLKKCLLNLPKNYLPSMLEDARMKLISIILFEEAIQYLQNTVAATNGEGINLLQTLKNNAFENFFINHYFTKVNAIEVEQTHE